MVKDGIYYATGMLVVAGIVAWAAGPWWSVPPLVLAAFFLWFFRDPERTIPDIPGAIVSPADGKVTEASRTEVDGVPRNRISIFMSVFDVHVNRSPVAGVVKSVEYRRGKFGNALGAISSEQNEQNVVTVEGEGHMIVFKQIAGLLARRIVFKKNPGESVFRGERVGLIKFGSRVDVVMDSDVALSVKPGDKVKGGASILARYQTSGEAVTTGTTTAGMDGER
jgi:phosphatidylserine decarboxylase